MPTDVTNDYALVAKFDDKDAAHIAHSMLRDAGIECAEEVKYRVVAPHLAPEQHDRAKILMENAGAVVVVEEYTEPSPAPARDGGSETTLT